MSRKETSKFWTRIGVGGGGAWQWTPFGVAAPTAGWSDGPPGPEDRIVNPVFRDNLAAQGLPTLEMLPAKGYIKKIGVQLQSAAFGDAAWNLAPPTEVWLRFVSQHPRPNDYMHPDGTLRPAGDPIQETIYAGRMGVQPFNCDGTSPNSSTIDPTIPDNLWGIYPVGVGNSPETRFLEYMNAMVQEDIYYHKVDDADFAVGITHNGRWDTIVTVHIWVEEVE